MADVSTNTQSVIYDSRNRPILLIANSGLDGILSLPGGESIPKGVLGLEKSTNHLYIYDPDSGWGDDFTLQMTGSLTGSVDGDVIGSLSVPLTGSRSQEFSNGGFITTGVIDEETTLSLVALATDGATEIPAGSRVLAVLARVTEVIDTATAIEIGITAEDTDGYATTMAVAAGTESIAQGALVGLASPRAAAATYTILANGQPSSTGKVRVQILYETLTAPTA